MSTNNLPNRSDVPLEKTWDLTLVYKTEDDWRADLARVKTLIPQMVAYKGRLRRSGRILLQAFKLSEELGLIFGKLGIYAGLHTVVDAENNHYLELEGELDAVSDEYGQAMSWMNPELSSIKPETIARFIKQVPALAIYKQDFESIAEGRPHVRTAEVEGVLALTGKNSGAPRNIFSMFTNADMKFPLAVDSAGAEHTVTHASYGELLESKDRVLRESAFRSVLGTFNQFRNSLAAMYGAAVTQNCAAAEIRGYESARAKALKTNGIPLSVYDGLISTVNANLPKLHDYLAMRKRILGVEQLNFWDLYVPIAGDVDFKLSYEEANEEVLKAVAVLGDDYVSILRNGIASRWVDVHENKGKRSGAFSSGAPGTPPFVLLNWTNSLRSAFTSAHEYGHSMHSYFTRSTQPFTYANYTIFVAEVASTLNEALFAHHLMQKTSDPAVKKFILGRQIEDFRATLFRQTMFAEFEKITHELREADKTLTTATLCKVYEDLNRKYFGENVKIDPLVAIEWARIPHFYGAFYVYQYATGIAAATALADQILTEGAPAVARYRKFLSSGSSDNSINLLRDAGVDLTDPAVIQKAIDSWSAKVAEFDKLS
jgi:oligoendopeptidase F